MDGQHCRHSLALLEPASQFILCAVAARSMMRLPVRSPVGKPTVVKRSSAFSWNPAHGLPGPLGVSRLQNVYGVFRPSNEYALGYFASVCVHIPGVVIHEEGS